MTTEVASKMQWDSIRYAQVWEDPRMLEEGLLIRPSDKVLMIASAGCNVFNLLLQNPLQIVALDMNPAQIAVSDLKIEVIRHGTYGDLAALVGVTSDSAQTPLAIYDRYRRFIREGSRNFFDAHVTLFEKPLMHQGRLEGYFRGFSQALLQIVSRRDLDALFEAQTLSNQRQAAQVLVENEKVKALFVDYFSKANLGAKGRDPAQLAYVAENEIGHLLWQRFEDALTKTWVGENWFLAYILTASWPSSMRLAPYLQEANFETLQEQVNKISLRHCSIESYLSQDDSRFDKAVLSDIFEYMSEENADNLYALLRSKISPKGRIAYWNLLVNRQAENAFVGLALTRTDRCFFYKSFHVDEAI